MMKLIFTFFLCCFFVLSCSSSEEGNEYFNSINEELSPIRENPKKIKVLYERELQKYKKTGDNKFLLSSKYVEIVLSANERLKQIPMVYELLRLNDNKYEYLSISCNFNLASQFEKTSPDWSLKCIDEAIKFDEKTNKNYFLPHLYHFKGRLFYNAEKYDDALTYFNKALQVYNPQKELIYIASMHNNIGMCYDKKGKVEQAIRETYKGINLLKKKKDLNTAEKNFINYMKGTLAHYYLERKDYKQAEKLFLKKMEFSLNSKNYQMTVRTSKDLVNLYNTTREYSKIDAIIDTLNVIEPKVVKLENKIILHELTQEYYADKKDSEKFKVISKKLITLNDEKERLTQKEMKINYDIADNYIIKNANRENVIQKRKSQLLIVSVILLAITFVIVTLNLIKTKKKKEELINKEKVILEGQRKILEQDVQLQKEKIRNLHLNLNLKTETEKTFLENLKKLKRSKNINPEEVLKDLQFKINNLLLIDKKNNDVINESSLENKIFMEKLSEQFPVLSTQELQLCVYFKLNLSAKEVSLLENYAVGSVRVYKTKIKSKLGLGKDEDLSEFLNKV